MSHIVVPIVSCNVLSAQTKKVSISNTILYAFSASIIEGSVNIQNNERNFVSEGRLQFFGIEPQLKVI